MKITIKLAIATTLLLNISQIFAQRPKDIKDSEVEGIYLNISDFKHGKLTIPTDKQHKGDKIKLKQFFISPDIISIEQDKETVFYKDSIFAIRLTNGENYRFINRTPYLIADTSYLYIYTHKTTKTEYKQSGPRTLREDVPVTYYYFSISTHSNVFPLTMVNIRREVVKEPTLHTAVCNKFTSDNMLSGIESETGHFTINEFILAQLAKSVKN